jgi:hypothetical protein
MITTLQLLKEKEGMSKTVVSGRKTQNLFV